MDNVQLADQFSMLAKLMDIHGENSFKIKSYQNAAFQLEKWPTPLQEMNPAQWAQIPGFGEAITSKIDVLLSTGELPQLNEFIQKTPSGLIEMLNIKGLGPKKIATIWKELDITSIGELLYACQENRLSLLKGFGAKTQQNIQAAIEYYLNHQGHYLWAQVDAIIPQVEAAFKRAFPLAQYQFTGAYSRQEDTLETLDILTTVDQIKLISFFQQQGFETVAADTVLVTIPNLIQLQFFTCEASNWGNQSVFSSCSTSVYHWLVERFPILTQQSYSSETAVWLAVEQSPLPLPIRGNQLLCENYFNNKQSVQVIETNQIRGIIHSHSTWSDGAHTIEAMANAAQQQGFEYLVISDHSRTAFYANGLSIERIQQQWAEIDRYNAAQKHFKIFKSVESDILNDGSLDYPDEILRGFDMVIASIHSNLNMPIEKSMLRLINAVTNPFTTILGHPTGRLLLSRKGYPVDFETLFDACKRNQVVVEINAHPRRLDLDAQWVPLALAKGLMVSIDPDAHAIEGFQDVKYGVKSAQKALLTAKDNLSSLPLSTFEEWVSNRKKVKGLG